MLGVVCRWSPSIGSNLNWDSLIRFYKTVTKSFGGSKIIVTDCWSIDFKTNQFYEEMQWPNIYKMYPDAHFVYLSKRQGSVLLQNFTPPSGDIFYCVGADDSDLKWSLIEEGRGTIVEIGTPTGKSLYSFQALSIALYHHYISV